MNKLTSFSKPSVGLDVLINEPFSKSNSMLPFESSKENFEQKFSAQ